MHGADAAWKTIASLYTPFQAFRHEPNFLVYWDYVEGAEWGMMGSADVWFRLPGLSGMSNTPFPLSLNSSSLVGGRCRRWYGSVG